MIASDKCIKNLGWFCLPRNELGLCLWFILLLCINCNAMCVGLHCFFSPAGHNIFANHNVVGFNLIIVRWSEFRSQVVSPGTFLCQVWTGELSTALNLSLSLLLSLLLSLTLTLSWSLAHAPVLSLSLALSLSHSVITKEALGSGTPSCQRNKEWLKQA